MLGLNTILKLLHSVLIIYLTFQLYEINKTITPQFLGIQLLATVLISIVDKKSILGDWKQLFLSLSLVYALRPTELNIIRYLFLAKIFYVHRSLALVSQQLFIGSWKIFRLSKVIFNFARLTFTFYMVLGIFIVAYKYWAYLWTDPEKTISTHQILYFFMITSSSIGYGDVTPKNQYQMYFLITFIPILIIAFGQYFGQAVGYFDEFIGILKEDVPSVIQSSLVSESIWGKDDAANLTSYISHCQQRSQTIAQQRQAFANNWLSIAAKNYESHQPLLVQILDAQDSKQYKLLVASKLKRHFYPQNWKIIERGNTDKHIFMIQEGEVDASGTILGAGKTFNLNGFSKQQPSTITYVTKSFTTVWAISVSDLVEIGKKSVNLQTKINRKLSQVRGEA